MKKSVEVFRLAAAAFTILMLPALISCTKVPIEDGAGFRAYPLVEIQINNTPSTVDDYVFTTAIPCRARLTNYRSFSAPVRTVVKNYNLITYPGPGVTFSSSSSPSFSDQALLDLPNDGTWADFQVQGNAANVSVRDKDVVIELVENRAAPSTGKNVVLSRKALMVTSMPLPAVTPQIELLFNSSYYEIDDYVTLSPTYCTVRLLNPESFSEPLTIRLQNYASSVGKLRFGTRAMIAPAPHATVPGVTVFKTPVDNSLDLVLPTDGSAVEFYVAGEYLSTGPSPGPTPSTKDKDAIIEITDPTTASIYGRWATMVRLRKNANALENEERDRFLNAVAILNASFEAFEPFIDIHDQAAEYNHSFCLSEDCSLVRNSISFLPWHRIFVLRMEIDLQAIDPSVAIPYWKYNEPAPNVFHRDFMGRLTSGTSSPVVTDIAMTNPLYTWSTGTGPDFRRRSSYNDQTGSPTTMTDIQHFARFGTSFTNFSQFGPYLEGTSHGQAHNETGAFFGMIVDFDRSPTDPLFYMLHANVDRIWAKWQSRGLGRYEPENTIGYPLQNAFPSPPSGVPHVGSYSLDEMWPWNGRSGTGSLDISDYPTSSYASFPLAPGSLFMIPAKPRPFDAIDYRTSRIAPGIATGTGPFPNRGMGFHYDDEIFAFNIAL